VRFQSKLLLLFALLFAIALLTRSLLTFRFQQQQLAAITSNMRNVTDVVHFATHRLASEQERDRTALNIFITDAVARYDALKEISIVNVHQEIIASSNTQKIGKKHPEIWRDILQEDDFHQEDTLGWYEMAIPIVKDQKVIGQVLASILANDVADSLNELHSRNIVISLSLFLSISLVSFIMIRRMMHPLQNLTIAARRIAQGDFDVALGEKGSGEHAELASAFNVMTGKLRELRNFEERLRGMERHVILSETAATLAHEIRNPLNFINLTAGRLIHKFLPSGESQRKEYCVLIDDLKAQVKYLNDMVNDFLRVGKPLKLHKTPFPAADLIAQTELLLKQQLLAKNITFIPRIPEGLLLNVDVEQMRLVLLNLIGNSIEVAGNSGEVILQGSEDSRTVVLSIRDNGPGIPAEDLEKIFEPYYTRRAGGTGLGLTLARRIIEEHDGRIHAVNNETGGASFVITLQLENNGAGIDC
jgi:signal transduction histidine kinase